MVAVERECRTRKREGEEHAQEEEKGKDQRTSGEHEQRDEKRTDEIPLLQMESIKVVERLFGL